MTKRKEVKKVELITLGEWIRDTEVKISRGKE